MNESNSYLLHQSFEMSVVGQNIIGGGGAKYYRNILTRGSLFRLVKILYDTGATIQSKTLSIIIVII